MRIRCFQEVVPAPLPVGLCPQCGRTRVPYLPDCICGHSFEAPPAIQPGCIDCPPRDAGVFRVVHWSDLHVGSRAPGGLLVDITLRGLLSVLHRLDVDAVIISGDLSKFGKPEELMTARELLDAHGFGHNKRIVVPGNHDMPPAMDSALFQEIFDVRYPLIRELSPGVHVAAFDSNELDQRTLFERGWVNVRGMVGERALELVRQYWSPIPSGSRLLVLHHHVGRLSPEGKWVTLDEYTLRTNHGLMAPLVDAEAVLSFANELKVTAILHGHKHHYSRTGYRVGGIPVFNAGSVTRMVRPTFRMMDFRNGSWERLYRVEVTI